MAPSPNVRGVSAEVKVNGQTTQEYGDENGITSNNTVVKYVEAISGANFSIRLKFRRDFEYRTQTINVTIRLDGQLVDGSVVGGSHLQRAHGYDCEFKGARYLKDNKYMSRPFRFSEIIMEDENEGVPEDENLGKIEVSLWRVKETGHSKEANTKKDFASPTKISEKDVKGRAVSHQANLDEAKETSPWSTINVIYIDPEESPFTTFVFHYRSMNSLKDLHIIPRTPTPVPLEDKPIEELSLEEMQKLLLRHKEKEAAAKAVKDEPRDNQKSFDLSVIYEPGSQDEGDDEVVVTGMRRVKRPHDPDQRVGGGKRQRIDKQTELVDLTTDN